MPIDWTKVLSRYKGKWVAFGEDEWTVMGTGLTAKQAYDRAQKKGCKKPILGRMPEKLVTYVGTV